MLLDQFVTRFAELEQKVAKIRLRPGRDGRDGKQGEPGQPGLRGEPGPPGIDVDQARVEQTITDRIAEVAKAIPIPRDGIDGVNGERGEQGLQGIAGINGKQGEIGPIGPPGPRGVPGPEGKQGEVGPVPMHEWRGTELRFELPGDRWGEFVDLRGAKGEPGRNGRNVGGGGGLGGGVAVTTSSNNYFPGGWT